ERVVHRLCGFRVVGAVYEGKKLLTVLVELRWPDAAYVRKRGERARATGRHLHERTVREDHVGRHLVLARDRRSQCLELGEEIDVGGSELQHLRTRIDGRCGRARTTPVP